VGLSLEVFALGYFAVVRAIELRTICRSDDVKYARYKREMEENILKALFVLTPPFIFFPVSASLFLTRKLLKRIETKETP
jgi:hypothetical protein